MGDSDFSLSIQTVDLELSAEARSMTGFERSLLPQVREVRLLGGSPWVRSLGKLALEVATQGWKFPTPPEPVLPPPYERPAPQPQEEAGRADAPPRTRIVPPRDKVLFKD